jgi:hypothetical protein
MLTQTCPIPPDAPSTTVQLSVLGEALICDCRLLTSLDHGFCVESLVLNKKQREKVFRNIVDVEKRCGELVAGAFHMKPGERKLLPKPRRGRYIPFPLAHAEHAPRP